ncbi:TPA: phage tail assembly protein [Yersinia enterocolitica]|uniref:phage tail assembly protein n=1 Tax=Yersinia enterocolitica TaxID=630 RepID=UPI0028B559FC|nr:phage tail assembly protein [Yersinia enterocolitica]ELI8400365.1 phage tail assembly protein [Yersinia enterocolitica]HEI6771413.1 phage tail assembly protein [Yersinia enterocolitica]HEI6889075.1 phage tail assembly protein [Yersinia enterocolitica]HEI6893317.1 phage tail assembly protein [Yersinia enterocolitica]
MKLTLTTPITAHGEEITEIEIRDPTGKDVRELGYPYQLNPDDSVKLLSAVVCKYITRLGNIPPSAVDSMSPPDLNMAGWMVARFFLGS